MWIQKSGLGEYDQLICWQGAPAAILAIAFCRVGGVVDGSLGAAAAPAGWWTW